MIQRCSLKILDGLYSFVKQLLVDKATKCAVYADDQLLGEYTLYKKPEIADKYIIFKVQLPAGISQKTISKVCIKAEDRSLFQVQLQNNQLVLQHGLLLSIKIKLGV